MLDCITAGLHFSIRGFQSSTCLSSKLVGGSTYPFRQYQRQNWTKWDIYQTTFNLTGGPACLDMLEMNTTSANCKLWHLDFKDIFQTQKSLNMRKLGFILLSLVLTCFASPPWLTKQYKGVDHHHHHPHHHPLLHCHPCLDHRH